MISGWDSICGVDMVIEEKEGFDASFLTLSLSVCLSARLRNQPLGNGSWNVVEGT